MPPGRRISRHTKPDPDAGPVLAERTAAQIWNTRQGRKVRAMVLYESDICGYCGHPGSGAVDHKISKEERPDLVLAMENLQPIHGHESRCYVCEPGEGRNCNREKSTKPMEDMVIGTIDWLT